MNLDDNRGDVVYYDRSLGGQGSVFSSYLNDKKHNIGKN